jgi:hypothetical protein
MTNRANIVRVALAAGAARTNSSTTHEPEDFIFPPVKPYRCLALFAAK